MAAFDLTSRPFENIVKGAPEEKPMRYALALVVVKQEFDGDDKGNGCWTDKETTEWAKVDEFDSAPEASRRALELHKHYNEKYL